MISLVSRGTCLYKIVIKYILEIKNPRANTLNKKPGYLEDKVYNI